MNEALGRAAQLRPGCCIADDVRQQWLREVDGMLREKYFKAAGGSLYNADGADTAWADGLQGDETLLVPKPFDALYPHYLCAMLDAALGESDRYALEQAQYNSILAELAVWLRRQYGSAKSTVFEY